MVEVLGAEPITSFPDAVFTGDFAAPDWAMPDVSAVEAFAATGLRVVNLEGRPQLDFRAAQGLSRAKINLASTADAVRLFDPVRTVFSAANNHWEDFPEVDALPLAAFGGAQVAGLRDIDHVRVTLGRRETVIAFFCFPNTDPLRWRGRRKANTVTPSRALKRLATLQAAHPDADVIAVVHFGYEMSPLPYPADRAWVRAAARLGVRLVIGHQSHVVQPVEWFGDCLACYSLGNLYLPEGQWFGSPLSYGGAGDLGLLVRWGGEAAELATCRNEGGVVTVVEGAPAAVDSSDFAGMDNLAYARFYRERLGQGLARQPALLPVLSAYDAFWGAENALLLLQDGRQGIRDALLKLGLHRARSARQA